MPLAPCPNVERQNQPKPARHLIRVSECRCLTEEVAQALRQSGHSVLIKIDVFVRADGVHLVGHVNSYHQKQIAQETVRGVFGGAVIRNELLVTSGCGDGSGDVTGNRAGHSEGDSEP
jgi:osmotically-inducible protein OsmY